MKKLLTLLMALVMVFALATPAMAWVGWDAPETADPEDELLDDFKLSGVKLEYIASSTATFTWNREYYAEYSPNNKGIVDGTRIRAYFSLVLPPYSDVPAEVKGQISTMAVNISAGNMQIEKVEVYRSVADGDRKKVNDFTVNDTTFKYAMNNSDPYTYFNSTKQVGYEFMVTGYAKSTKDVTVTAKLSVGQSAFVSNTYTFTTANGVKYTVKNSGSNFYITNTSARYATPGTVRFTVDKDNKVTDIAVAVNAGSATGKAHSITNISKYAYDDYVADNKDMEANNAAIIKAYQRAIVKQHFALINKDAIDIEAELVKLGVAGIQTAYNNIAAGLGLPKMYYDRDTANATDPTDPDSIGGWNDEDILDWLDDEGYSVIYYTELATYRDIKDTIKSSDGKTYHEVTLSAIKYGIYNGNRDVTSVDEYYYASTNANTAKTVFTTYSATQGNGYQTWENVYNAYKQYENTTGTLGWAYYHAVNNDWCGKQGVYEGNVDYYQLPTTSVGSATIAPGDADHADYLAIFEEVLKVLGFEWDGTTKYMYRDKFIELFGANVSLPETLTWKAYTADLIVPDGTEPPQTGDSASIVGFVMIALAVLAAGAVVIKKVRA